MLKICVIRNPITLFRATKTTRHISHPIMASRLSTPSLILIRLSPLNIILILSFLLIILPILFPLILLIFLTLQYQSFQATIFIQAFLDPSINPLLSFLPFQLFILPPFTSILLLPIFLPLKSLLPPTLFRSLKSTLPALLPQNQYYTCHIQRALDLLP